MDPASLSITLSLRLLLLESGSMFQPCGFSHWDPPVVHVDSAGLTGLPRHIQQDCAVQGGRASRLHARQVLPGQGAGRKRFSWAALALSLLWLMLGHWLPALAGAGSLSFTFPLGNGF